MCEYKDVFKGGIVTKAPDDITFNPWRRFSSRNVGRVLFLLEGQYIMSRAEPQEI